VAEKQIITSGKIIRISLSSIRLNARLFFWFVVVMGATEEIIRLSTQSSPLLTKGVGQVVALLFKTEKAYRQEKTTFGATLKTAIQKIPTLLFTQFLLGACLILLTFFFFVPGLIASVMWVFTLQAVILRGQNGTWAFELSARLVKGHWWSVLKTCAVLFISTVLPLTVLMMIAIHIPYLPSFLALLANDYLMVLLTCYFLKLEEEKEEA
jgi:hypothetical protein